MSDSIRHFAILQSPVFLLNSRSPRFYAAASSEGALLIPKLQSHFAEFLQYCSLIRLSILYHSTCVGLQYGSFPFTFLAALSNMFNMTLYFVTLLNKGRVREYPLYSLFKELLRGRLLPSLE